MDPLAVPDVRRGRQHQEPPPHRSPKLWVIQGGWADT